MSTWVAVAGVGLGSLAMRLLPLLVFGRMQLTTRTETLIARAGLAAIVALVVVSSREAAHGAATWPTVGAMGVGAALASRQASMLRIVVAGGAVYAALRLGAAL